MGFGSFLGMKMIDVPLKIVYYVLDHFNFESLEVEFDNCEVSVDSKSVQEMLGLPSGGSLLSNMDYISENNEESWFEWEEKQRDIDLSSIDWCDYIVDCLVRTKKVYNPEKESSFFYGPAAYLMSGGFGCGHVNEAYVEEEFQESEYNEEESGGDEVESDGEEDLCDEDEEDFDVNKVSDVEVYESKISCMYQKMEDLKKDLVVKIDEGVLKFPQNYGNDFLSDDENVEDYDQGKCSGGQGDGSGPHEGNIGKNHVEGKGDDDEDDEQGNGSGCNKEEAMNLNSVVENVTKSVGLIDSQEGVSFSQFICDPVVESFLKTLDQGTDGCLNQKLVEDDVNLNLTGIDDAKKDGEGEDVEDCSNKNKDGENLEDVQNKNKDSNETRSLKMIFSKF
ncbi:unnamed protein product [Lactuca virosa]|uniref:Uncharacterized protein n=1 Tax=Lactuca virosa TaxID=75947 RepID=A0AAU9MJI4_9ASTR|nr:unnamed protein product [Lactuca virosa]